MKILITTITLLALASSSLLAAEPVSFRKDIAPMLLDNCVACHGAKKAEGSYRIDSFARATTAGDSELAPVTAAKIDDSELLRRLTTDDDSERMPLDGDPVPAEQIALVKRWIEEGAKYDADDPSAALKSILPVPTHPDPPQAYKNSMPITALAISPDGNQILAGGYHELTVWSTADGRLVKRMKNVGQRTYAITYSPDGKLLAIGCGTPGRLGEARLFDTTSGKLVRVLGTTSDVVQDVAFNPAGDRVAVAAADSILRIFEVATGKEQLAITSHSDWIFAAAWNADGSRLVTASRDKTSKVFDAKTGELLITYSGHAQPVKGVAFHPDGKEVFSAGTDKKIHRWKIADGKKSADVTTFGGEAYKLTTGGGFLFGSSEDKSARQFNLADSKQVRAYAGHSDWVLSTAYHDATKRLATGGFDGQIKVWSTADGKELTSFTAAPGLETATK